MMRWWWWKQVKAKRYGGKTRSDEKNGMLSGRAPAIRLQMVLVRARKTKTPELQSSEVFAGYSQSTGLHPKFGKQAAISASERLTCRNAS